VFFQRCFHLSTGGDEHYCGVCAGVVFVPYFVQKKDAPQ